MSYDQFKEFHEKHPDLDNQEYYAEFPKTNKSTIRSWKNKARKPIEPPPATPPAPLPSEPTATALGSGWEEEMVKLLCTQTKTNPNEFEGVDTKSALMILKAKLKNLQLQDPPKPSRAPNTPILPNPKPIGQSVAKFGLDQYIKFTDEINMEIPMSKLMNPEDNEKIREIIP